MKTEIDYLVSEARKEEKYFRNYLNYAKAIKKEIQNLLEDVKVYVFGSILKRDEVPQDIDVLIISKDFSDPQKKAKVQTKIWKKMGVFSPFELHFASPEEYNHWWKHFLKEKLEI